jgi:hypothetical protein
MVEGENEFTVDMDAFRQSLPEELRGETIIKEAKDVGSIAQMLVDTKKTQGQRVEEFISSVPGNGDQNALDVVHGKLGWPGIEGKYEVTRPEEVPGIKYSEDMEAKFLTVAKELRLNGTQVNKLIAMQHDFNKEQLANNLKEAEDVNAILKTDWGADYDKNKGVVKGLLEKYGDEGLVKLFNETELGSNAPFAKFVHAIGKGLIEVPAPSAPSKDAITLAKDEAMAKISSNRSDPKFNEIYNDPKNGGYADKQAEMQKLFDIVHGTEVIS